MAALSSIPPPRLQMRNEAPAILAEFSSKIPVDVYAMARKFGIAVWKSSEFPAEVSGKIFPDGAHGGQSGFSIVVNAKDGFYRQRFTVAHELAHFIYHHAMIGDGLADDTFYRSGLPTALEVEANRFAADIIMPERGIRYLLASGVRSVEELAKRMQVSQAAMRVRLSQLNLIIA